MPTAADLLRSDLERLATLDRDAIHRACTDPSSLPELIGRAIDEYLGFDDLCDEHLASDDLDEAVLCRQEAAAWRATVIALRAIPTRPAHRESGAA